MRQKEKVSKTVIRRRRWTERHVGMRSFDSDAGLLSRPREKLLEIFHRHYRYRGTEKQETRINNIERGWKDIKWNVCVRVWISK